MWYCNRMASPFYNDDYQTMIASQQFFQTESAAYACAAKEIREWIRDLASGSKDESLRWDALLELSDKDVVTRWADGAAIDEYWEWGWYEVGEVIAYEGGK